MGKSGGNTRQWWCNHLSPIKVYSILRSKGVDYSESSHISSNVYIIYNIIVHSLSRNRTILNVYQYTLLFILGSTVVIQEHISLSLRSITLVSLVPLVLTSTLLHILIGMKLAFRTLVVFLTLLYPFSIKSGYLYLIIYIII